MKNFLILFLAYFTACFPPLPAQNSEWININTDTAPIYENHIKFTSFDNYDNKWIAGLGLWKYDNTNWERFLHIKEGDWFFLRLKSVISDPNDIIWACCEGALAKYESGNWTRYYSGNSSLPIANNDMTDMIYHNGKIWITTWTGGLVSYDGITFTTYDVNTSNIPTNGLYGIAKDSTDNFWLISNAGLIKFDGTDFTLFNGNTPGFTWSRLLYVEVDSQNNVYATSDDAGLLKYDGVSWSSYNRSNSDIPSDVNLGSLAIEGTTLWMFIIHHGLIKYDGENWTNVDPENQALLGINDISIDQHGNKWISTFSGIWIYREGGVIITSVENEADRLPEAALFPNPSEGKLSFEYESDCSSAFLTVSDINGRELLSKEYTSSNLGKARIDLPTASLPSGEYFYRIHCGARVFRGNFIVTK